MRAYWRGLLVCAVMLGVTANTYAKNTSKSPAKSGMLAGPDRKKLLSVLERSNGEYSDALENFYLVLAERNVKKKAKVSADFWAWLGKRSEVKFGVLAANFPVHPGTIENLDKIRLRLGDAKFDKYANLCIAFAVAQRRKGVDQKQTAANISPEKEKHYADNAKVAARYLEREGVSFMDFVKKPDRYLPDSGVKIARGQRSTFFKILGADLGLYPHANPPTGLAFLEYLIRNHETKLPRFKDGGPEWPLFPVDAAPWPLLMPLATTIPLEDCEFIWEHFTGEKRFSEKQKGQDRVKKYSRYTKDYSRPHVKYKKSDWHPDSYPRILEDGGVCGRQSAFANKSNMALGLPSIPMGQPGHSALVKISATRDGRFYTTPKQSLVPMYKSKPRWHFDDCDNFRGGKGSRGYHVVMGEHVDGLVLAMNQGLSRYLDTRIALHVARMLPDSHRLQARSLLYSATKISPYNARFGMKSLRTSMATLRR